MGFGNKSEDGLGAEDGGFLSWLNLRIWGFSDGFWVTKRRMGLGGTKPRMEAGFSYGV